MATQTLPGGAWFGAPIILNASAPTLSATGGMTASGHKFAYVFRVPRTGTLETCEFRIGNVNNNPDNGLRISFQNLDANGDPDGTQDQYRDIAGPFTTATWVTPGIMSSDGTDGGTKRSVTGGDWLAVVIEFTSFVASDNITFGCLNTQNTAAAGSYPTEEYTDLFTASWVKTVFGASIALKYVTDGYVPISENFFPILSVASTSYGNGSTPDERAMRFRLPTPCVCDGAWVRGDFDGDCDIILYSTNGSTVLGSCSIDASARVGTTGMNVYARWAGVSLAANTTYYLSVKPTTATTITLYEWSANSAGLMAAAIGGSEWYLATQTDAGGFSTTTTTRPFCGLHLSAVDDAVPPPSGGGALVNAGLVG